MSSLAFLFAYWRNDFRFYYEASFVSSFAAWRPNNQRASYSASELEASPAVLARPIHGNPRHSAFNGPVSVGLAMG
jgi:hypothetical protein